MNSPSLVHALSVDTSTCANISDHHLISFDLIPTKVHSSGLLSHEIYSYSKADIVNLSEYLWNPTSTLVIQNLCGMLLNLVHSRPVPSLYQNVKSLPILPQDSSHKRFDIN